MDICRIKKHGTDVNNGRKFDFLYNLTLEESNKVPYNYLDYIENPI